MFIVSVKIVGGVIILRRGGAKIRLVIVKITTGDIMLEAQRFVLVATPIAFLVKLAVRRDLQP